MNNSNSNIRIRNATSNDLNLLMEFIQDIAEFEGLAHEVSLTKDELQDSMFGSGRTAEAIIAENEGDAVGFAVFFQNFSTFKGKPGLYLEDLFVKPDWRKHGIGRALLVRLAQIAVERDCPRFEWVALDWNQNAIDFYEKLGAKQLNDWRIFRMEGDSIAQLAAQVIDN